VLSSRIILSGNPDFPLTFQVDLRKVLSRWITLSLKYVTSGIILSANLWIYVPFLEKQNKWELKSAGCTKRGSRFPLMWLLEPPIWGGIYSYIEIIAKVRTVHTVRSTARLSLQPPEAPFGWRFGFSKKIVYSFCVSAVKF
jgi:hypothetical protein